MAKAFGMNVMASKRNLANLDGADSYIDEVLPTNQMATMLGQADFVSLHLPLSDKTRGVVGSVYFKAMRPDAYFINIARGEIVEKSALIEALKHDVIAGAAIDVFWDEENFDYKEFESMRNLICTPHIAGASDDCLHALANAAAINIQRVRDGLPPLYQLEADDD